MTEQEKLFNEFLDVEPTMSDSEYETAVKELAEKLKVKKGAITNLVNLSDTSYYNSAEFEKALKSAQAYREGLRIK